MGRTQARYGARAKYAVLTNQLFWSPKSPEEHDIPMELARNPKRFRVTPGAEVGNQTGPASVPTQTHATPMHVSTPVIPLPPSSMGSFEAYSLIITGVPQVEEDGEASELPDNNSSFTTSAPHACCYPGCVHSS